MIHQDIFFLLNDGKTDSIAENFSVEYTLAKSIHTLVCELFPAEQTIPSNYNRDENVLCNIYNV